jgi:predicted nicotinamide N-methyase
MPARTQRRANGLTILSSSDPRMRALRRAGHVAEIHGNKAWNASFLLMEHLKRHPLPRSARVLELGCGWGLLGMFCAKRFGSRVHGIDADAHVLPYLELHAALNGVELTAGRRRFDQLTTAFLGDFDVIVGADICFWDTLGRDLWNLIRRARKAGVERIRIADPGRPPFTELAERCEARFDDAVRVHKEIRRPVQTRGEILAIG